MSLNDHLADFLALRQANELLRQKGIEAILNSLSGILASFNEENSNQPGQNPLLMARQEWQFTLGQSTLLGERLGLRLDFRTIVFEIGWPRLPEHGHVPGGGLARGRVGFSQNLMLEPRPVTGLILRKDRAAPSARWYLTHHDPGQDHLGSIAASEVELTDSHFAGFLSLLTGSAGNSIPFSN